MYLLDVKQPNHPPSAVEGEREALSEWRVEGASGETAAAAPNVSADGWYTACNLDFIMIAEQVQYKAGEGGGGGSVAERELC